MNNQCRGEWHDYPNCEGCPMLMDTCDGNDEYNDEQPKVFIVPTGNVTVEQIEKDMDGIKL